MADVVDDAQEAMEALADFQKATAKEFVPIRTGFCIECEEPTEFTFCSVPCQQDNERRERIKAIAGK